MIQAGMNSLLEQDVARKYYLIQTQKPIRECFLLALNHSSIHGLKIDFHVFFFGEYPFRSDFRIILSLLINLFKFLFPCYSELR